MNYQLAFISYRHRVCVVGGFWFVFFWGGGRVGGLLLLFFGGFSSMETGRELGLVAQITVKLLSLTQTPHRSQCKLAHFPQFSNADLKC